MADISSVMPTEEAPEGSELVFREIRSQIEFRLKNEDIVGRESAATSILSSKMTVSRNHAKVTFDGSTWRITDMNSTNGTWVNGTRIIPMLPVPLHKGDIIKFSRSCEVTVIS